MDEIKIPSIRITSGFKLLLCFITFVSIIYFIIIERDFMKALFLLNIIANYRIMLAFLTDWNEEIIFKKNILTNDSHGILSERKLNVQSCDDEEQFTNMSNFVAQNNTKADSYKLFNAGYEDKINYNYNNYDSNFAWWTE